MLAKQLRITLGNTAKMQALSPKYRTNLHTAAFSILRPDYGRSSKMIGGES